MNSNQPVIPVQHDRSTNPLQQLKSLVQNNLISTITATIAGSLLLTGALTWNIWSVYNSFQSVVVKGVELQKISSDLLYQDEVLTMSARMSASTGEPQWRNRYKKLAAENDITIKKFLNSISTELRADASKTNISSDKLLAMEDKSFKLVEQGKQQEAAAILNGAEYAAQKKIYGDGSNLVLAKVDRSIRAELDNYQQQLISSVVFAGATLPILLASWTLVLLAIREYIRDRQAAAAMLVSRTELIQVNDRLNQELENGLQQEAQIRLESELLQTDVGHILDVVCSLEEGDLTVQAQVNERATGLVSDTLNRLIESLDRIVSAVVDTAQQVTTDAGQLAIAAIETTQQAQSQAIEVRSVQLLMDNINALTADSRQQAIDTAIAVQQAKSAVVSGKQAIDSTTAGIDTLQQGTDQIVKRAQLLTEFVDLAAQFSKDQKRVAALTRVLALNVSTLSSRAIQERDPEQFASLAKEFETIALQVNTLATDTNYSLASLQQKTDRVQTVTSGLTQDISDIDLLVQKFTTEVDKSRQAFDNIETVTEQVSQMSKKVNSSSQDIVRVVSDTLIVIQSISSIAQSTEAKASITRQQVESMGTLANKLLQMVEFFNLNDTSTPQLAPVQPILSQLVQV
ncbi:MAG: methyl-accepting chemotaxis protein [Chamaesiphon sp.]|nr:methyl-accepting chemotaxis protein [Chamaesiphon sp.]